MVIYKVIADEKPVTCFTCPIQKFTNAECGKIEESDMGGGWKQRAKVPDERCIFDTR